MSEKLVEKTSGTVATRREAKREDLDVIHGCWIRQAGVFRDDTMMLVAKL
jgi:hypothetical protein